MISEKCTRVQKTAQLGRGKVARYFYASYRNTFKKQLRHGPSICIDAKNHLCIYM